MNQTFIEMNLGKLSDFIANPDKGEPKMFVVDASLIEDLTSEQVTRFNNLLELARQKNFDVQLGKDGEYTIKAPVNTLYENNQPDTRYDEALEQVSVFRPRYRKLTGPEMEHHDAIKNKATELWDLFNRVDQHHARGGREVAIAKTKLEEAVMWAVKGLTK